MSLPISFAAKDAGFEQDDGGEVRLDSTAEESSLIYESLSILMVSCGINDLKVSIDSKMYVRRVEALSEEWFTRQRFQALQANA
jgi:hypothetical protein